jgi:hypothetical protein
MYETFWKMLNKVQRLNWFHKTRNAAIRETRGR